MILASWYPHPYGELTCKPIGYCGAWLWRLGSKRHWSFHLLLFCITLFWGKPPAMPWDRYAGVWRGPCVKDMRPSANSHLCEPWWKWILWPQSSLQMIAALADSLSAAFGENVSQNQQLNCSWILDAQKLWERIFYFCCRPLRFGE